MKFQYPLLRIPNGFIKTAMLGDQSVTIQKIAATLQSDNYNAGLAGWRLTRAGNFEANNAVFRGQVIANAFSTIPAGSITAGTITATIGLIAAAISGGTITGTLFQTASSGRRIIIGGSNIDNIFFVTGNAAEYQTARLQVVDLGVGVLDMFSPQFSSADPGAHLRLASRPPDNSQRSYAQLIAEGVALLINGSATSISVDATNGIVLDGNVTINGPLHVTGTITNP